MRSTLAAVLAAFLAAPLAAQEITTPMVMPNAPTRYCAPVMVNVPSQTFLGFKRIVVAYPCARVGDEVRVATVGGPLINLQAVLLPEGEVLTAGQVTITFQATTVLALTLGAIDVRLRAQGY